ncbi:MAG: hypothetical protein WAN66_13180 [Limnoraphis robusta]|uniref:hypothetical protein n=1 Tax=Limnoraphis robusta TaxID=1118279 RepID=UPI002B1EA989|nr:hypothetical protein [Limnoraphis robusta]MEA5498599.1 hypothetical protein [Limnoraphis robusta BA-68 BA1]MEA5538940.1 hypothetical protein [Limnoraphis robusta Tam1]
MVIPGWTVVRSIPPEVIMGLITGKYKDYGGVIRWAAGTENAGQIVRHLVTSPLNPVGAAVSGLNLISGIAANAQLFGLSGQVNSLSQMTQQLLKMTTGTALVSGLNLISGIVGNVQLEQVKGETRQIKEIAQLNTDQLFELSGQVNSLSQMTQQVLQIATGTTILSGLNLTVSCVSFAVLYNRLNAIDNRLQEIQKDVKEIKSFLETSERAQLFYALKELLKADDNIPVEHRHTILHDSRKKLGEINMRYQELLSHSNTIEIAMANEEYFSLTALAHARCTAELGMLEIALKEIEEMNLFWQTQARRVAKSLLIGEYPQRFIATDFVDDVLVLELTKWLDFAYKDEKGLFWIEELRRNHINEFWYSKGLLRKGKSGLNQNVGIGLEKEKTLVIPALRKLMARSDVFEGYVSQYELLKNYQMKPSEFEKGVAALPESSAVDGYFILEPAFELTGF